MRMIHLDRKTGSIRIVPAHELAAMLVPGDLVVINDSGTLPASLRGRTRAAPHSPIELRLATQESPDPSDLPEWWAALLGAGSWRSPTERRPAPARVQSGDWLDFGPERGAGGGRAGRLAA